MLSADIAAPCADSRPASAMAVTLEADRHLHLSGKASWQITCTSGLVWITREGSLEDWVLRGGETRRFESGAIVLGALRNSDLRLVPDTPAVVRPVGAVRVLAGLLARRLLNHR